MIYALNIALILLGVGGTLAAFGGETWTKGIDPLRRRITRRGWVALSLMICTLGVGVAKELLSRRDALASARKLEAALADNRKLREQVASMQEALTNEIRNVTRGPIHTVTYLVVTLDGSPVRDVAGLHGLHFGDHVYYKTDCQPPKKSAFERLGIGPPRKPVLTLVVNEVALQNLGASGEFELKQSATLTSVRGLTGLYQAAVRNPYLLTDCRLEMYVNSTDPLRRIVDQRMTTPGTR